MLILVIIAVKSVHKVRVHGYKYVLKSNSLKKYDWMTKKFIYYIYNVFTHERSFYKLLTYVLLNSIWHAI